MLKRDKADELYKIAIRRFQNEKPNVNLSNHNMESIWYSVYGVLNSEGEDAARKYVESAKLIDFVT